MTAADHRFGRLVRGHVECSCGWIDDGDHPDTGDAISSLMEHAYEIGHHEALDAVTDTPEMWRKANPAIDENGLDWRVER